jgi:hypothetical protein
MSLYRITRTTLRGSFENHLCFINTLTVAQATSEGAMILTEPQPGNDGGPNDRSYTLWRQDKPLAFPPNCDAELMTSGGKNGWATQADAVVVLEALLSGDESVQAGVESANAKATSVANIAASAGKDIKAGAEKVGEAAKKAAGAVATGYSILFVAEAVAAGALAWWAVKRWLGGRK